MRLDARIPSGPIEKAWDKARFEMKLVSPANKRKYEIIVVGSGLAGGSAAATLAELGYTSNASAFRIRRAVRTPSPHKAVLTRRRIIRTMAIASIACSMTPLRGAISGRAKPMYIAWLKSV